MDRDGTAPPLLVTDASGMSASPSAPRRGECVVLESEVGGDFVVISHSSVSSEARVVRVCGATGRLLVGSVSGVDVFGSVDDACDALRARGYAREVVRGAAALGYATLGDVACVLVAKKVHVAATLPTGDEVLQVRESMWVKIPLRNVCAALSREERANAQSLFEFSVDGTHFYCETFDVSRPFPYGNAKSGLNSPDREWVWNAALAVPLRATNIAGICPTLIQGLVEQRELRDANDKTFHLCIFGKRSSLHPGTRYLARGLNEIGAPGNEVEMEQLVWCEVGDGNASSDAERLSSDSASRVDGKVWSWSSYVWRRGSVPISWAQEIKQAYGEAEIQVSKDNPYRGTSTYFSRLLNAYRARPGLSSMDRQSFPVTCVNLLRCAPGKPELLLSEHFHEAIRGVRQRNGLSDISVLNFDWHSNCKALGEAKTVEGLWVALRRQLVDCSISTGSTSKHADDSEVDKSVTEWQRGLLRYNCADSLDRTNLAGFFVAAQVLTEQCAAIGLEVFNADLARTALEVGRPNSTGPSTVPKRTSSGNFLPPGWESRTDATTGRTFYIDHNTRTTSWTLPTQPVVMDSPKEDVVADLPLPVEGSPGKSKLLTRLNSGEARLSASGGVEWLDDLMKSPEKAVSALDTDSFKWLGSSVDDFRQSMLPQCLTAMVEIFLANGDFHAQMYTSTRASHTATIHLLDADPNTAAAVRFKSTQTSASSTMSNATIGIQRRFFNMVSDGNKQQQLEMFLGLNKRKYFPSILDDPGFALSRATHSRMANSSQCIVPALSGELSACLLSSRGAAKAISAPLWITSKGTHELSLTLDINYRIDSAPEYLLITTPGSVSEYLTPSRVEMEVSYGSGSTASVSLELPRVSAATPIMLPLQSPSLGLGCGPWGFNRGAQDLHLSKDTCTKVSLRLCNDLGLDALKDAFLTVGQVELISAGVNSSERIDSTASGTSSTDSSPYKKPPRPNSSQSSSSPCDGESDASADENALTEADYERAMSEFVQSNADGAEALALLLELEIVRIQARMSASARDAVIARAGRKSSDLNPTLALREWLAKSGLQEIQTERSTSAVTTASSASSAISSLRSLGLSSLESFVGPMIRPNSATLSSVTSALGSQAAATSAVTVPRNEIDERCERAVSKLREVSSKVIEVTNPRDLCLASSLDDDASRVEASADSNDAPTRLLVDESVQNVLTSMPNIRREYMRSTFEQSNASGSALHVGVPSSVVVGFKIVVPDQTTNYAPSLVRVSGVSTSTDSEHTDVYHIGDYMLPATKPRTILHYEFGPEFARRQPSSILIQLYVDADARDAPTAPSRAWSLYGRCSLYAHAIATSTPAL